jgi:hypothetical protein
LTTDTETSGSAILSYELEVDDGLGGAFLSVVGNDPINNPYTLNSALVTTAIISGRSYRARYKAYNVHGWSSTSPEVTIIAATVPGMPAEPTLTIDSTNVRISWSNPTNTGGDGIAITAVRVEIRLPDGTTYQEEPVACNGATSAIVSATQCDIPMSTFTTATASGGLGFAQAQEITARITVSNSIGFGPTGPVATSSTVIAQLVPHQPTTAPTRGAATSSSQIVIDWQTVVDPQNGGSAVTSYNLQWDNEEGNFNNDIDLTGVSSDYTLTTFT